MNAYRMMEDLRDNIVESSAAHWDDAEILRKMNKSQRKAATMVLSSPGDWLLKSADLTPASSLVTLPADCAKPVYMEDSDGHEVPVFNTVRERNLTRQSTTFSGYTDAYLLGSYIEINQDGYSDTITLWYQRRVPNLHFGECAAAVATSLTLDTNNEPSMVDDYYNDMTIEVMTVTGNDIRTTITDYAGSTSICTLTAGTPVAADPYGLISVLPEECMQFIIADATCGLLAKPGSSLDPQYFQFFLEERKWAAKDMRNFLSTRLHGGTRSRTREL